MNKDFIGTIKTMRVALNKTENDMYAEMLKISTLYVDLAQSGGGEPISVAYSKLQEACENIIETRMWLGVTLEKIGHITEDSDLHIEEIKE